MARNVYWAQIETTRGFTEYPMSSNLQHSKRDLGREIKAYPLRNPGAYVNRAFIWPGTEDTIDTDGDPIMTWEVLVGWRHG